MNHIPWILPNESLSSYLQRLVRANNYVNVGVMAEELTMSAADINNNECVTDAVRIVSDITRFDIDKLNSMSSHAFKSSIGSKAYEKLAFKNKAKYCPLCVQQSHYNRLIWTLYPVTICLEHETLLIEECQCCSRALNMNTFMDGYCLHCQFEFKHASVQRVNPNSVLFLSQIDLQRQINGRGSKQSLFGDLSLANYLCLVNHSMYLLEGLKRFTDYQRPIIGFYNKEGKDKTTENSAHAYASVYFMYDEFPKHFFQVLDAFQKKSSSIKYMQKSEFEKVLRRPEFKIIKETYETYWVNQADLGNIRTDFSVFRKDPLLLASRTQLSREEVKNIYGLTYKKVNLLSSRGTVRTKIIPKQRINRYRIDKSLLERAIKQMNGFLTRSQASKILGLQRDTITKLISAGVLILRQAPDGCKRLKKEEVEKLLNRCRNELVQQLSPVEISFHRALEKYNHCGLSAALLIELTLRNDLKSVSHGDAGTLSDVYYDENDLLKQIKRHGQTRKGYFMSDLQKIFHFGEKTIWAMAHNNILTPDKTVVLKDGRKHYIYDKTKVDLFKQNHITIKEAVIRFEISDATIRRWLVNGVLNNKLKGISKSQLINVDELRRALGNRRNLTK